MIRAVTTALGICAIVVLTLSACTTPRQGALTVSAAASLTEAFTEIGAAYESRNPGTEVRFNFAGSSTLAEQINSGAPVDVFAAASSAAMRRTYDADSTLEAIPFATNSLAIATPAGNPARVTSLADLERPDVAVLVCDIPVPCGAAAQELFDRNGLTVEPASLERDVRAVLTKVIEDEADAGIVYRTDIVASNVDVTGIDIPSAQNVTTTYEIAPTISAGDDAQRFIDFVRGAEGVRILKSRGFGSP